MIFKECPVVFKHKKYYLKIYITGQEHYQTVVNDVKNIFPPGFDGYELKVIDVHKNPQLAEEDRILATPTLVKEYPLPVRKVIGDLSNRERVAWALGINYSKDLNKDHER